MTRRYLSRNVVYHGHPMGLAVVTIHPDGRVEAEPFTHETPATAYTDLPVTVTTDGRVLLGEKQIEQP